MAKRLFRRPKHTQLAAVVAGVQDALRPEEIDEMLLAGDGLFWQRQGEEIKLYSPEVVSVGVEAMWDLWERINALLPANGSANGTTVNAGR